jgi:serine/threonine-protein kinase
MVPPDLRSRLRAAHLSRVVLVYAGASWAALEATDFFITRFGLPGWFLPAALGLLVIGIAIILSTALVQAWPAPGGQPPSADAGGDAQAGTGLPAGAGATRLRRLLSWRNAIVGGVLAFALWGVVAAGWLILGGRRYIAAEGAAIEAAEPDLRRLVVLPFDNVGPAEREYFAIGITEEITSRLAAIGQLRVISRTSAIKYKDTDKTLREIGEELDVDYVVEGTVLWQEQPDGPDRVRVTLQLIRVADDTHVWANRYDAVLADIFEVQSAIAEQVIEALDIALLEPERRALEARPTKNLEAYDYYLRGNDYLGRGTAPEDQRRAVEFYTRAVELDPEFALAHARLSIANARLFWFRVDPTAERIAAALAAAERALELQPDLPEAQMALGYYRYYGLLDFDGALEQFVLAQRQRPNDAELWAATGYVQRRQARWQESLRSLARAMELDPRSRQLAMNAAVSYQMLRQYDEAERLLNWAIAQRPDVDDAYSYKAQLRLSRYGRGERVREVLSAAEKNGDPALMVAQIISGYRWSAIFRIEPDYRRVLARATLAAFDSDSVGYFLSRTSHYGHAVTPERDRAYYDSARAVLEARLRAQPEEAVDRADLALAYAGLGRPQDAAREAARAAELLPVSRNSLEGAALLEQLAEIYARTADYDAAMEVLERALAVPNFISTAQLRADPLWDPIRDRPRFQLLSR